MKKVLCAALTAALGLTAVSPAFATETRINSLSAPDTTFGSNAGQVWNEKSVTIRDSANIFYFPQFLPTYKNSVDVDATSGAIYGGMNIRYALSDDAVLLLFGRKKKWQPVANSPTIGGSNAASAAGFTAHDAIDPTNHQFGIGFGMKAGESMRLGTTLSIGGASADGGVKLDADGKQVVPAAPYDQNSNLLIDFNAGLGFDLNETNALDFGINVRVGSFTNIETRTQNLTSFQGNGLFGIAFTGKGEFQVHQIAKLVPFARVAYDSRGVNNAGRSDTPCPPNGQQCDNPKIGTFSGTALNLGTDLAISPVEGVLIQPGAGLVYRSTNLTGNSKPLTDPNAAPQELPVENSNQIMGYYGFAAEAKAFEWMVLRLGARQNVVKTNFGNTMPNVAQGQQQKTNETHSSTVTNTVSTGMGIKLMGWQLDLNVQPQFFNNGVFAVTGQGTTTPFALDFALGYDW